MVPIAETDEAFVQYFRVCPAEGQSWEFVGTQAFAVKVDVRVEGREGEGIEIPIALYFEEASLRDFRDERVLMPGSTTEALSIEIPRDAYREWYSRQLDGTNCAGSPWIVVAVGPTQTITGQGQVALRARVRGGAWDVGQETSLPGREEFRDTGHNSP